MPKIYSTVLIGLILGANSTQALGIYGTGASFSTSSVCKKYSCQLVSKTDGNTLWIYRTKYGDTIGIGRENSTPNSKINTIIVGIQNPESKNYALDREMVNDLQRPFYGRIIASLPEDCYFTEEPIRFATFSQDNKTKYFGCDIINDIMMIGLGGNK